MTDYKKYINALRKCANEHEKDRTFTGHIIVSDLCRDTANLLETLKEEPVLDKIKAEIKEELRFCPFTEGLERALEIIDKHKAESEE